eukprot:3938743-Pleurochrysis_carterae.AAC.5
MRACANFFAFRQIALPSSGEVLQDVDLPGDGLLCGLCSDARRAYVAAYDAQKQQLHVMAARRPPSADGRRSTSSPSHAHSHTHSHAHAPGYAPAYAPAYAPGVASPAQERPVSRRMFRPVTPAVHS